MMMSAMAVLSIGVVVNVVLEWQCNCWEVMALVVAPGICQVACVSRTALDRFRTCKSPL
jgi:hypothetical protein